MTLQKLYLYMHKVKYLVIHNDGELIELDKERNITIFYDIDYEIRMKNVVMFRAIDKDTFEIWL